MNILPHFLKIQIHKMDGSSETFIQDETDMAKRILGEFEPDRIFSRERIIIADHHSLTSFPVGGVVRLDLVFEPSLHWLPSAEMVRAVELSETEFHDMLLNPELRVQWDPEQPPEASAVVFLEVEMVGQPTLFLVMEIVGEPLVDPQKTVATLFAAPVLCFRMRSGGVAALNLAHLLRVTFFPGAQPVPLEAWPAQHVRNPQPKPAAPKSRDLVDESLLPPTRLQSGRMISGLPGRIPNEGASTTE